jgi:hypothetical protein
MPVTENINSFHNWTPLFPSLLHPDRFRLTIINTEQRADTITTSDTVTSWSMQEATESQRWELFYGV